VGSNLGNNVFSRTTVLSGGWGNKPGILTQVSIGADKTYVGVSPGQQLFKYTPTNPSWVNENVLG
jgi:hypothetical protein